MALAVLTACAPLAQVGPSSSGVPATALNLPARQHPSDAKVVKVYGASKAELSRWAAEGFDIWEREGAGIVGEMPAALYTSLSKQGRRLDIVPFKTMTPRNTFDKGYHTYEKLVVDLRQMAASHPDIAQLHDIGD